MRGISSRCGCPKVAPEVPIGPREELVLAAFLQKEWSGSKLSLAFFWQPC